MFSASLATLESCCTASSFFMTYQRFISIFSLFFCIPLCVHADHSRILESIMKSHEKLDSEFGDLHCQWKAGETIDGETRDYLLSFWSKDAMFYRFDKAEIGSNGEAISTTTRMVIRPEGFVVIRAANADDAGVVIDFGSNFDGFDILSAEPFFNSATRISGFTQVNGAIEFCLAKKDGSACIGVIKNSDSTTLDLSLMEREWRSESSVLLDVPTYRCLSSTIKSYRNGKLDSVRETRKKYDENLVVPATHVETRTYSDGAAVVTKYERTFCSFDSPSLEVFAITASGLDKHRSSMAIWSRRLVMLGAGLSAIVIYHTYRRRMAGC